MPLLDAITRRRQLEAASNAELQSHMVPGQLYQLEGETDRVATLNARGEYREIAVFKVPRAPVR